MLHLFTEIPFVLTLKPGLSFAAHPALAVPGQEEAAIAAAVILPLRHVTLYQNQIILNTSTNSLLSKSLTHGDKGLEPSEPVQPVWRVYDVEAQEHGLSLGVLVALAVLVAADDALVVVHVEAVDAHVVLLKSFQMKIRRLIS